MAGVLEMASLRSSRGFKTEFLISPLCFAKGAYAGLIAAQSVEPQEAARIVLILALRMSSVGLHVNPLQTD